MLEAGGERSQLQQAERGVLQKQLGHRRQCEHLRPGSSVQRAALQIQFGRRGQGRRGICGFFIRDTDIFIRRLPYYRIKNDILIRRLRLTFQSGHTTLHHIQPHTALSSTTPCDRCHT